MPNRFNDFTRFKEKKVEDMNYILETSGVTGDLYRPDYDVDVDEEVGDYEFIRRILLHIQPADVSTIQTSNQDVRINKENFVALTNEADIMPNDKIKIDGIFYKVVGVDKSDKVQFSIDLQKE